MRKLSIGLAIGTILLLSGVTAQSQEPEQQIYRGVIGNNAAELRRLAEEGVDFSQADHTEVDLMAVAAVRGTTEIIGILARNGVDINRADGEGYTPIMRALEAGRIENARVLRDLGASLKGVTNDGYTVRVLAEIAGLEDFGPEYASRPPNTSQEDMDEMLLLAAESGDVASAQFALNSGASARAKVPANGWSAVMLAALSGNPEIVELLIGKGSLGAKGEPLETIGDGVDVVVATLVGEGGPDQNHDRAGEVLEVIKQHRPLAFETNIDRYRRTALKIGYSTAFLRQHFPLPSLQPVDFRIRAPMPGGSDGWRQIQTILKEAGFYDAAVDGVPGRKTLAGLTRYGRETLKTLHARCVTATKYALSEFELRGPILGQGRNGPLYLVAGAANATTGTETLWLGEFRIADGDKEDWYTTLSEAGFVVELLSESGTPTGDMICRGGPFDVRYYNPDANDIRLSFSVDVPDGTVRFAQSGERLRAVWQDSAGTTMGDHQVESSAQELEFPTRVFSKVGGVLHNRKCDPKRQLVQYCQDTGPLVEPFEFAEDECGVNLAGVDQCTVPQRQ